MSVYDKIDELLVEWNKWNSKIENLWDTQHEITNKEFRRSKAIMRKQMQVRSATISKISPLLQAKSEKDFIDRMAYYEANRKQKKRRN